MIKSSSIFLYIPLNQSSGIPYDRFGIILPKSYPHKFISVYLINSVYPHHLCVPAFIWVPTLSVYPHHLSSAMRAFPS